MIILPSAFYQHVFNVDLDIPLDLVREHFVYEPFIHRACVLKAEWHYFVVEEVLVGNKRSLLLVRFVHPNLIITRKGVLETQYLVLSHRVYLYINSRERVSILGARFFQVREVYAHPPFSIGFLDHYYVC